MDESKQHETDEQGAPKQIYSVRYSLGKNYDSSKSIYLQDLREHGRYMQKLLNEGKLVMAGPFANNSGAQIILNVANREEANSIIDQDPAICKSIFVYEIQPWDIRFQ